MTRKEAYRLRAVVETAAMGLDDKTVSTAAVLLPRLKGDSQLVKAGTRINWKGTVKRAAVDLWDTEENNPDNAPNLWEDIGYKDGYRIIPESISAGAAFALGEKGWWKDVLYESTMEGNVWTPETYSDGWKVAEQGGNEYE